MIRDRYGRLRTWIESQSIARWIATLIVAILVFVLVVQPLAGASNSFGRESPIPFLLLSIVTFVIAATVIYVVWVTLVSFVRQTRSTEVESGAGD